MTKTSIVFLLAAIFLCSPLEAGESFIKRGIAPDFSTMIEGRPFNLYKYSCIGETADRVIFLHFFSAFGEEIADLYGENLYCESCEENLRTIEKLYQQLRDRDDILIIGVNVDFKTENALRVVRKNRVHFPIIYDRFCRTMESYGVEVLPTSFIIRECRVKYVAIGVKTRECYLKGIMDALEEAKK